MKSNTRVPQKGSKGMATPELVKRCLRQAKDTRYVIALVRLPKATKVGTQFRYRLANQAEQYTHDRCWRVWKPEPIEDAGHRNYILRDSNDRPGRYLKGLVKALEDFGLLSVAEIFHADAADGMMRRVAA